MSLKAARGSVVRLRSNVKTSKRCEASIRKVLLHRSRALYVLGVDDHYSSKTVLCYKPSDFLSGSLENGIVCVHPVQVMVKEDYPELLWSNARNTASAFLAKTAFGIRCLNHEMRSSVSSTTRTDQSMGYGIARSCHTDSPSTVHRIDPSLYSFEFRQTEASYVCHEWRIPMCCCFRSGRREQ